MSLRTFAYKALGCKVNQYEGDTARAWLESRGLVEVSDRADLVVLNTCAVTHRAVQKGRQSLRRLLNNNPGAEAVLTGCMTENDIPSFKEIAPDLRVVANRKRDFLLKSLREVVSANSPDRLSPRQRTRAFLKVQDGCNLRCSYCIIPELRGRSRSRPLDEVVDEYRALEDAGHSEVVLCGIHLGHWGHEFRLEIADLVRALAERGRGLARLRLSSLEANELSTALIKTIADWELVVPHLHLPLQSGSPKILKEMRRPYTAELYRERTDEFRSTLIEPAITTDIITGFPGETDQDFRHTLDMARSVGFSKIHAFPFSPREGTDAAKRTDSVPPDVIRSRQASLIRLERELRRRSHEAALHKKAIVVAESAIDVGRYSGFTERYHRVEFQCEVSPENGLQIVEPIKDCGTYLEAKWLGAVGPSEVAVMN